jgi:hypothetical protein
MNILECLKPRPAEIKACRDCPFCELPAPLYPECRLLDTCSVKTAWDEGKIDERCPWEAEQLELVGKVGVDSGTMWIGDPCYIVDNWHKFMKQTHMNERPLPISVPHSDGIHKDWGDKGVVSSTGFGDGIYPVYARKANGRVWELRVVFDERLLAAIEGATAPKPIEESANKLKEISDRMIAGLTEKERKVLELRFGIKSATSEQIQKIEAKALDRLRARNEARAKREPCRSCEQLTCPFPCPQYAEANPAADEPRNNEGDSKC